MAQDAFGHPTGEGGASAAPNPASTATAMPATHEPRKPSETLLLGLWALITAAIVVIVLVNQENKTLNDPVQQAARGEITGVTGLSLLNPTQLTKALAAIQAKAPHDVIISQNRIDPTHVDLTTRSGAPGYAETDWTVDNALKVSKDGDDQSDDRGLTWSQLDPAVPAKILAAVNAKTNTTPKDVDYFVLQVLDPPRDSRWIVFLKSGVPPSKRSYLADLHGNHITGNGF